MYALPAPRPGVLTDIAVHLDQPVDEETTFTVFVDGLPTLLVVMVAAGGQDANGAAVVPIGTLELISVQATTTDADPTFIRATAALVFQ